MAKLLTAICFDGNGNVYKYRKIKNSPYWLTNFENFIKASKNCIYINYYDRETKLFFKRQNLQ